MGRGMNFRPVKKQEYTGAYSKLYNAIYKMTVASIDISLTAFILEILCFILTDASNGEILYIAGIIPLNFKIIFIVLSFIHMGIVISSFLLSVIGFAKYRIGKAEFVTNIIIGSIHIFIIPIVCILLLGVLIY